MVNEKYRIGNQGKTEFTEQEITKIERLLTLLRFAPSHKQKNIRQQLRDIGFYISKYGTGLTVERFRNMVATGKIKEIKNNTDLEIEIFVHGALCYSYSGQCLMSSFKGGRSGNRGSSLPNINATRLQSL